MITWYLELSLEKKMAIILMILIKMGFLKSLLLPNMYYLILNNAITNR